MKRPAEGGRGLELACMSTLYAKTAATGHEACMMLRTRCVRRCGRGRDRMLHM